MAKVTKDTMIGELLQETIAEAAMVHGIEPDDLVNDINDFLEHDLA